MKDVNRSKGRLSSVQIVCVGHNYVAYFTYYMLTKQGKLIT